MSTITGDQPDLDKLMQAIDKFVDNKNGDVWDEDITSLYVTLSANRTLAEDFIREQLYNQASVIEQQAMRIEEFIRNKDD